MKAIGASVVLLLGPQLACSGGAPVASSPPLAAARPSAPSLATAAAAAPATAELTARPVALPGAEGGASMDYVVYDRASDRVWLPLAAGAAGLVDVLDPATATFTRVDGFATAEREMHGKKRTMGPSAASVGDGVVYVGNRATSEVCPVDDRTLARSKCLKVDGATDGVVYVAPSKEVWVTTPHQQAIAVLDATTARALVAKTVIKTPGDPEGYAVDAAGGRFFTNLEDKDRTIVIDVKTHEVTATWSPGCGADGPRGLAFDDARDLLVVACTDHLQILDAGHDGAPLGQLATGAGVDNLDYSAPLLYAAAGKAARLTIARLDDGGRLTVVATGATGEGARNAVADAKGNVYVPDARQGRVLIFAAPAPR